MMTIQKLCIINHLNYDLIQDIVNVIKSIWFENEAIVINPPTVEEFKAKAIIKTNPCGFLGERLVYTDENNIQYIKCIGGFSCPTTYINPKQDLYYCISDPHYILYVNFEYTTININNLHHYNKLLFNKILAKDIVPFYYFK
jgi:hypothetical protein